MLLGSDHGDQRMYGSATARLTPLYYCGIIVTTRIDSWIECLDLIRLMDLRTPQIMQRLPRSTIRPYPEYYFLTDPPRETTSVFVPLLCPKSRYLAPHFYGVRTERIRSSQLKSLRIKKKSKSRVVLTQKLCLGGCTIIVVRGGAGLDLQSKL